MQKNNKKKIKICFCMFQIITGGIEVCLLKIIEQLLKTNKYEIVVAVDIPIKEQHFIDFFKKHSIEVINANEDKKKVKAIFNNVDIIIDYFNCSFMPKLKNISTPKIGVWHSSIDMFFKDYCNTVDYLFNTYDKFVCLTQSFLFDLVASYPHYENKIAQIYNPFDIEKLRKLADIGEYPKDCDKYFTFLGRFHPDKDHNCVIDAFNSFIKKNPDGKIYFLGEGDKEAEYKEKVKNLHLEDKIIFIRAIPNPYGYLKHCCANILSSPSEGLSNVLVEGAILGVLNISSDCKSAPKEVLLNGKGGILYPVGDSNKLAIIMDDVWNNKIDKSFYINNANQHLYRFEIKNIIEKFENLINEVIYNHTKHKFLKKLFYITTEYSENKKRMVIKILNLKIKIKIKTAK